ncbi:MAG TPA: response regulator [Gemmatimonadaceae bacterium]|jgi:two-component system chemotaxis response regulator CheY
MKILICDDDPIIRMFVQRAVEQASHEAVLAEHGREALDCLESEDPDLLITDLQMPELDGFGLVKAIRGLPRFCDMPILCLSSVNDRDAIASLIEQGIAGYLLKPVRPSDFVDRLHSVTSRARTWKTSRAEVAATAR